MSPHTKCRRKGMIWIQKENDLSIINRLGRIRHSFYRRMRYSVHPHGNHTNNAHSHGKSPHCWDFQGGKSRYTSSIDINSQKVSIPIIDIIFEAEIDLIIEFRHPRRLWWRYLYFPSSMSGIPILTETSRPCIRSGLVWKKLLYSSMT